MPPNARLDAGGRVWFLIVVPMMIFVRGLFEKMTKRFSPPRNSLQNDELLERCRAI
jgi:hypothetical protein